MRRQINNLISVGITAFRVIAIKLFCGKNFKFSFIERISPNVVLEFDRKSCVTLGTKVRIHSGCKVKARKGAKLSIGDNTKINYNCIIACHDEIYIGEGTEFGPSVYIYDHDHDYKKGFDADSSKEAYKTAPVHIGKKCWIGANTVILRGTVLGDRCVVGAGSVIKGNYPAGSLITQKRETNVKQIG